MGIILKKLGSMKFGKNSIEIEYNFGEEIHFEIDNIRIAMSRDDFIKFAKMVKTSRQQLLKNKNILE